MHLPKHVVTTSATFALRLGTKSENYACTMCPLYQSLGKPAHLQQYISPIEQAHICLTVSNVVAPALAGFKRSVGHGDDTYSITDLSVM